MCGIVGYIGTNKVVPILINGLKRLEYRGYDSAGLALMQDNELIVHKKVGKLSQLESVFENNGFTATMGIGHTRWATHGEPNEINAHPHISEDGKLVLVHNGIIENYKEIKRFLQQKDYTFQTETDTEALCQLIQYHLDEDVTFPEAVRHSLIQIEGTYGIVVMHQEHPDMLIVARHGSPLVIGHDDDAHIIASDVSPLIEHTSKVTYLDDSEMALITKTDVVIKTIQNEFVHKSIETVDMDVESIEKSGYEHFMLKEIMQQSETLNDTMRGRLILEDATSKLGGIGKEIESLLYARRVVITACGTSWHAALVGEYLFEELLGIPVEVEYASEFRYRNPVLGPDSVVIAISQSGETADTLAAIREAKRHKSKVFGICNVVGSTIARETDAGVYLHAGPEIGVASTKAFTSQVMVLTLMALRLGRIRALSSAQGSEIVQALEKLPEQVAEILAQKEQIQAIAEQYQQANNFLYLGRGYNFPVALEGALKLKEISYIHAEGYPAAEMKHGPIALIDDQMPVVVIAPQDSVYDKVISNIQEVRTRKGRVIAIATQGDEEMAEVADHVIYVPKTLDILNPIVNSIPLQLLAYYIAVLRGCDVDQPRNLAKSVTVE